MSFPPIPPLPQTQCLSSKTFKRPPLDGSLTIPELYEWVAKNSPEHPLFVYPAESGEVKTIYWKDTIRAIHRCARMVKEKVSPIHAPGEAPVIAILAHCDAPSYLAMHMSVLRANYISFPLSARNSPAAVAHLIKQVDVKYVFVGREPSMKKLLEDAFESLKGQDAEYRLPSASIVPLYEELYGSSDGSTSFPKPIRFINRRLIELAATIYYSDKDLTGLVFAHQVIPLFHMMGLLHMGFACATGVVLAVFEPKSPAILPTPDNAYKAATLTKCQVILTPPSVIEAWSTDPEHVKWLASLESVVYGGGALNRAVGDYLVSQGVCIINGYGRYASAIFKYGPVDPDDWEYLRLSPHMVPELIPYGENTYELVIMQSPLNTLNVVNTEVNGIPAFATSDLLLAHPEKPGCWKLFGRVDDQIMHSTGEKTNPGPLEKILNRDPHVEAVIFFGAKRFQAGVLVDPKPEFQFDPSDEEKLAEFRNKIWSTVQKLNEFAPQHSRIVKEMITVSKPSKPFQYTAKSTLRRNFMLTEYREEIDALYNSLEMSAQTNVAPPTEWDLISTVGFVREVVNKVLVHKVKDEEDIFQYGCDSLQATYIKNILGRTLHDAVNLDPRRLSDNFVYEHPTILALSSHIVKLATNVSVSAGNKNDKKEEMQSLVDKYTAGLTELQPAGDKSSGTENWILVTGTTGGLGSHILATLASNEQYTGVYALNRPSKRSTLLERQQRALADLGLDAEQVLKRVELIEADISVDNLGISQELYQKMQRNVSSILHNAWRVDFNLSLASFEPNVKSVRNLLAFSLTSARPEPLKFIYTSSIAVLHDVSKAQEPLLEEHVTADISAGNGYAESKWVSEQILLKASELTPVKTLSVRLGQLSGGLNGAWNIKEWLPSMIQSARAVKCIPADDKNVSWIPIDLTAKVLVELALADFDSGCVTHIIHPQPVPWTKLANAIASELGVSIVPYNEWLSRLDDLSKSESNGMVAGNGDASSLQLLRDVPALRLLSFFHVLPVVMDQRGNAFGFLKFSVQKSLSLSKTLSDPKLEQLGEADAKAWIGYWRRTGFLAS
ncbi:hypothetical protein M422DRAFT_229549 [Sphaerobolus stellatus SS14]|uniref:Polyketide synthase-like phosphopantetheine-binding domain-containing protein n=1 Tax=Sphaerobolus stellatus (strain SS14) TaxID=990650 RepID=A0A0C9V3H9_SPHS4|nr:hypothetical protein M422DRAFT_229549 [Sphaerobolus stellatus SS14]